MRMSCGVGPFNRLCNRETAAAVMDSAAFVGRSVGLGLGFSSLGAGGGGAAVWGAEASGDIDG